MRKEEAYKRAKEDEQKESNRKRRQNELDGKKKKMKV